MLIKEARGKRQEAGKSRLKSVCFFLLSSFFVSLSATAQCAMCRASLESEGNKTKVEAVNDGIVFLMAVPYIIVAVIGFAIYRMYFKKTASKE
jgi:heme/copper-type cytochrome/quinol oxidase subunit 2